MKFADYLQDSIDQRGFLVAGFDPQWEDIPAFIRRRYTPNSENAAAQLEALLVELYQQALLAIAPHVCAIKPNIAFFEQFGCPGLAALERICAVIKATQLPIIIDAKRGDIGNTNLAYCKAFLDSRASHPQDDLPPMPVAPLAHLVDAITVNCFLGLDTLEPFLRTCVENEKGIFVLVRTSNPGSAELQGSGEDLASGSALSAVVAKKLGAEASTLEGLCGYSGLGAVVGATYPSEAQSLRLSMPTNFFLVPGFGAQGGAAEAAFAGYSAHGTAQRKAGLVVNSSRGIFSKLPNHIATWADYRQEISQRAKQQAQQLLSAQQVVAATYSNA
jgi:orotidine-5'-phosphate decarboxylase